MCPLTIYRASAGSGKTFRLTRNYLELLFSDPLAYRHILAVTFTNKAASEMKSRILDRLHKLASLDSGGISGDLEHLVNTTGKSAETIIQEARQHLVTILNDYSRFSVGTIDRFFQSVIRAFAREIGLPPGFMLELDTDRILGEAVDRMFMKISTDRELRDWLMLFAETRLENEQNWNFRKDILSLGKQLFTEGYQQMELENDTLVTREMLRDYATTLDTLEKESKLRIAGISRETISAMKQQGIDPGDLPGKSRNPAAYFLKVVAEERFEPTEGQKKAVTERERWLKKSGNDPVLEQLTDQVLMPALARCFEFVRILNSIRSVRPYLFTFGILTDISESIRDISAERNLFLLSDAASFLHGLVRNNPTPFIYEKTGNAYRHIMLDEFQDTSDFQWQNFKPLLNHTLSVEGENLAVGDIKQSIYRWRNSDWKILADEIVETFREFGVTAAPLAENWRSREQIVRFNNELFSHVSTRIRGLIREDLQQAPVPAEFAKRWNELIDTAYREVNQEVPESNRGSGGFVRCEIFQQEERSFKECSLEKLPEWIEELQLNGYRPADIAILVRSNAEGESVAARLMEYGSSADRDPLCSFEFVSNDALFIHKHPAIRFLYHLLSYLNDPADRMNNLHFRYYLSLMTGSDLQPAMDPGVELDAVLPVWFTERKSEFARMPLHELVELLTDAFSLERKHGALPYLQAFQNIILEQQRNEPVNLNDFLKYWKEFGQKKTLMVSDGQDAIRILTIHKAKGLEFKAVIVPFVDWSLTTDGKHETILWCRTGETIFKELPVVPVKYTKSLLDTVFASDYLEEKIMGYVDSLNLLYVALTRAEEALYVALPERDEQRPASLSGHLVAAFIGGETQTFGAMATPEESKPVTDPSDWKLEGYPVSIRTDRLRLRLRSADYFTRKAENLERQVDFGNMMHDLLRQVREAGDLSRVIRSQQIRGLISSSEEEQLLTLLSEKLASEPVRSWFSKGLKVLNEREIMDAEGRLHRPDRVVIGPEGISVIDYKFGDGVLEAHKKQVRSYMGLLEEIYREPVRGFLWYVMRDEIIETDSK